MRAAHVALFNQRTQAGQALGCSFLLGFYAHGSGNFVFDQNVKDVDGQENVLAGIQNNSGYHIGLTGYNGPNNAFSNLRLTGGHESGKHTSFVMKDFFEHYDETDDSDDDDYGKLRVTPE